MTGEACDFRPIFIAEMSKDGFKGAGIGVVREPDIFEYGVSRGYVSLTLLCRFILFAFLSKEILNIIL